jgi:hypothetical protein
MHPHRFCCIRVCGASHPPMARGLRPAAVSLSAAPSLANAFKAEIVVFKGGVFSTKFCVDRVSAVSAVPELEITARTGDRIEVPVVTVIPMPVPIHGFRGSHPKPSTPLDSIPRRLLHSFR